MYAFTVFERVFTLKKKATRPAAKNLLQQQAKFDHFIEYYNRERPHQALQGQLEPGFCRSECRHQRSRRQNLASQLHALRFGVF